LSSFPSGGKEMHKDPPVSRSKQSSGVLRAHLLLAPTSQ
jgi:hypothetical protein